MTKNLVIIESPFSGPTPEIIERNTHYARHCVRDSVLRGEAPIASHLLFTQQGILRDDVSEERKLGIESGHAWMRVADCIAVYTDYGISPGMNEGIDLAKALGIFIEYRKL